MSSSGSAADDAYVQKKETPILTSTLIAFHKGETIYKLTGRDFSSKPY